MRNPMLVLLLLLSFAKLFAQEGSIVVDIGDTERLYQLINEFDEIRAKPIKERTTKDKERSRAIEDALDHSFKINSLEDIKKGLTLYNDIDKKWEIRKHTSGEFCIYRSIGRSLQKHFNTHPEDFEKLDLKLFDPEAFASAVSPATWEADRVFCEMMKKFADHMGDDSAKKKFLLNWGLDGAGSEHYLALLNYISSLPDSGLKNEHERISRELENARNHVALYEELGRLDGDAIKGWKTYYLWIKDEFDKIRDERSKKIKEIYNKYYEGQEIDPYKQLTREEEIVREKYQKEADALKETLPPLYNNFSKIFEDRKQLFSLLPPFAKDRKEHVDLDLAVFFREAVKQGGKIMEKNCYLNWPESCQILVEDENGRLRYILLIPYEQNQVMWHSPRVGGVMLAKAMYDQSGEPVDVVISNILPISPTMRKFFEKHIVPLAPRRTLYDSSGRYLKTIDTRTKDRTNPMTNGEHQLQQ